MVIVPEKNHFCKVTLASVPRVNQQTTDISTSEVDLKHVIHQATMIIDGSYGQSPLSPLPGSDFLRPMLRFYKLQAARSDLKPMKPDRIFDNYLDCGKVA